MEATDTHFKLRISDNGCGMPVSQARSGRKAISFGVGIPAMRVRLQQLGGALEIRSSSAEQCRGTTLYAAIPHSLRRKRALRHGDPGHRRYPVCILPRCLYPGIRSGHPCRSCVAANPRDFDPLTAMIVWEPFGDRKGPRTGTPLDTRHGCPGGYLAAALQSVGVELFGPDGGRDFPRWFPDHDKLFGHAQTVVGTASSILANILVIVFLGFLFSFDPQAYRDSVVLLVKPSSRDRARNVLDEMGGVLPLVACRASLSGSC